MQHRRVSAPGAAAGLQRAALRTARSADPAGLAFRPRCLSERAGHGMRLLVTGGAGFIGSNFVRHVHRQRPDWEIVVYDLLTYAGDSQNVEGLERVVAGPGRHLRRAADRRSPSPAPTWSCTSLPNRITTTRCSRRGRSCTRTSSAPISCSKPCAATASGCTTSRPTRSTATSSSTIRRSSRPIPPYNPSSPYSSTKAGSDLLVRAWVRSFGVRATISNCSNNYGPYQHVEKFIPRQITEILEGRRPKLYGAGENVRDWIHTEDHSSGVLAILEQGRLGETYLIGADGERSNRDVVELILELMGRDPERLRARQRPPRPRPALRDRRLEAARRARLAADLPDFEQGLEATIAWYGDNADWWRPQKRRPRPGTRCSAAE